MRSVHELRYLFLDLNAYFASVEQQENPRLIGRPVAVVPIAGTDTTCAIAASYEAKRYGVKTGTRIREARQLCPTLVTVPARHDLYVEYHRRIMAEIENHLPIHRVMSIDEAACRLLGAECEPAQAMRLGRAIKDGIRKNVGDALRASVGIAPSVLTAKIAADLQKPDGLVVLQASELPQRLLHLQLTDLPGIGFNMAERLARAGVHDVAALWALTPKQTRAIWGSVVGERFWYALRGADLPDIVTGRHSIGHSRVLSPDMRPPPRARFVARALLLKAAVRLRRYGLAAGALGLSVRSVRHGRFAQETDFLPTQDSFVLLAHLDKLWRSFTAAAGAREPLLKTSVWLFRLEPIETRMPDLFAERFAPGGLSRGEALWRAVDKLGERYGRNMVTLASEQNLSLQYLGAKIAFTRVPDPVEFRE